MKRSGIQLLAERWSKIISDNPEDQKDIEDKVSSSLQSKDTQDMEALSDRFQQVRDRDPEFLKNLFFIVGGDGANLEPDCDKQDPYDFTSIIPTGKGTKVQSKKELKESGKPLADYSSDEIRQICGRYNLMSLENFLSILNRINMATSGNLLKDTTPKPQG